MRIFRQQDGHFRPLSRLRINLQLSIAEHRETPPDIHQSDPGMRLIFRFLIRPRPLFDQLRIEPRPVIYHGDLEVSHRLTGGDEHGSLPTLIFSHAVAHSVLDQRLERQCRHHEEFTGEVVLDLQIIPEPELLQGHVMADMIQFLSEWDQRFLGYGLHVVPEIAKKIPDRIRRLPRILQTDLLDHEQRIIKKMRPDLGDQNVGFQGRVFLFLLIVMLRLVQNDEGDQHQRRHTHGKHDQINAVNKNLGDARQQRHDGIDGVGDPLPPAQPLPVADHEVQNEQDESQWHQVGERIEAVPVIVVHLIDLIEPPGELGDRDHHYVNRDCRPQDPGHERLVPLRIHDVQQMNGYDKDENTRKGELQIVGYIQGPPDSGSLRPAQKLARQVRQREDHQAHEKQQPVALVPLVDRRAAQKDHPSEQAKYEC